MNKAGVIQWTRELLAGDFIIVDTETTGIEVWDEPIQIGVIDGNGNALFESLIKPTVTISPRAQAVHGISEHQLVNAPSLATVCERLFWVMAGKRVIAYNQSFDSRMLLQACRAHSIPYVGQSCRWECAMENYAAYYGEINNRYGGYKWQSLEKACRQMGVPYGDGAHTAVGDCLATLALIRKVAE